MKKNFKPSSNPSNVNPLMMNMSNTTYGNVAVK